MTLKWRAGRCPREASWPRPGGPGQRPRRSAVARRSSLPACPCPQLCLLAYLQEVGRERNRNQAITSKPFPSIRGRRERVDISQNVRGLCTTGERQLGSWGHSLPEGRSLSGRGLGCLFVSFLLFSAQGVEHSTWVKAAEGGKKAIEREVHLTTARGGRRRETSGPDGTPTGNWPWRTVTMGHLGGTEVNLLHAGPPGGQASPREGKSPTKSVGWGKRKPGGAF